MEDEIQNKRLQRFTKILLFLSIVILIFAAGYRVGEYYTKQAAEKKTTEVSFDNSNLEPRNKPKDMELFWSVWALIEQKYADQKKVKPQEMLYGAIKGMVASLDDPYSYFLTPKENQQSKDDLGGKYEGIGAELGMKNNQIIVVAPLSNSPAEKAGVRAGDVIIAVDGLLTRGWTLNKAVDQIRGEQGTVVKLTLLRGSKELEIKIKREQIKVKSVKLNYKGKTAVIKVSSFGDDTINEWDQAVAEVAKKWAKREIKGLIVDVRGNPGGYLEGSVYLASEFLSPTALVIKQEYADQPAKEYWVERRGKLLDIPLVVLIDEGSASASEIFAGSLRDHNRAKLVGRKTFGKGSVQEALDLVNNTGLHLTIAKWVLPKGDWINSKGIEPDFNVEIKLDAENTITDETDSQLQKALSILTGEE